MKIDSIKLNLLVISDSKESVNITSNPNLFISYLKTTQLNKLDQKFLSSFDFLIYLNSNKSWEDDDNFKRVRILCRSLALLFVGNSPTSLQPIFSNHAPLLIINVNELDNVFMQSMLGLIPVFNKVIIQFESVNNEIEATKQIADLNIERLHRTLKDLEAAKVKTEEANRLKQLFLASVTHELRTPLTAIIGFSDLIDDSQFIPEQKKFLSAIKEASHSLLKTVNDVLNFAKIEEGKLDIYNEPFNLYHEVKSVIELLVIKAKDKDISLELEFDLEHTQYVIGDRFRLKQVLTNLVSNAIKFTKIGFVRVSVRPIMASRYKFEVEDSGIGIQQNKMLTIFESFTQAEENTTTEFGGTGLGLAIAHKIVTLMGGEIKVESKSNIGTKFQFQINLPPAEKINSIKNVEEVLDDISNLTILAVEDNHLNQMLLQKLLSSSCKKLVIAGDGEQGVDYCSKIRFDVILMDLQLPKISGLGAVKLIKKTLLNKVTPIAVISANVWEEQLEKIRNHNVHTIIQKPFVKSDLINQIALMHASFMSGEISLNYLYEVSDNDQPFVIEVLQTYINNVEYDLSLLSQKVKSNDVPQIAALAHKMKSSFKMLKIEQAIILAEALENDRIEIEKEGLLESLTLVISNSIVNAKKLLKDFQINSQ